MRDDFSLSLSLITTFSELNYDWVVIKDYETLVVCELYFS